MNIYVKFNGEQKKFHWYWLPLIYKHQECTFYFEGDFTYPKDIKNLRVNAEIDTKGPTLYCPMDRVPTYYAMVVLTGKKSSWTGTTNDLNAPFYEVSNK